MKVLILGVNGFIGNALVRRILKETSWEVYGMDLNYNKLGHSLDNPRFRFVDGDIAINKEWIEYHIKYADVVLPLVAIATPMAYVQDPLGVFTLDFEENLTVIRQCVKYDRRIIFPSTSEVYGMCPDEEFLEDDSNYVLGPIHKQRWIYACCKQLLDRVIWAYGQRGDLCFTLIRPFNWIGPRLDDINSAKEGSSRVVTQFITNLYRTEPIRLVDGGLQTRCFTWVEDGIDCLMKIIENQNGRADGQIFNIGNPDNVCSIRDLAYKLKNLYIEHPDHVDDDRYSEILETDHEKYYGQGYQDILHRRPSIEKARHLLDWNPETGLDQALSDTLNYFLQEMKENQWPGKDRTKS